MTNAAAVKAIEDSYNNERKKRSSLLSSSKQACDAVEGTAYQRTAGAAGVGMIHRFGDATSVEVGDASNFYAIPDCSPACLNGHPMLALDA